MTNDHMTTDGGKKPPQRFIDEADAMEEAGPVGSVWVHSKSSTAYEITGYCWIESDAVPAVLYSKYDSDIPEPIWARPATEFFDGRFTRQEATA